MFLKSNEERFFFEAHGAGDEFHLVRMSGKETLSQSFRFEVEVVSKYPDIELTPTLGQTGLITLHDQTNAGEPYTRYIHGIVTEAELEETNLRQSTYHFVVEPKTELLNLRSGCRIFQQQTTQEIVTTLLEEAGFSSDEFEFKLQEPHPAREYCVQYNETELHFIQRLLEEEGIHYHFEHEESLHRIIFSDSSASHLPIPNEAVIPYFHDAQGALREQHIFRFDYTEEVVSGRSQIRDYDFTRPKLKLESYKQAELDEMLEVYTYPGRFQTTDIGDQYAQVLLQSINAERKIAVAESDVNRLIPGFSFTLDEHERDELNAEYYITQIEHKCAQPQVLEQGATTEGSSYSNRIKAIPFDVPYRAPITTAVPIVHGCQTAIVCGPEGEEIYTDQYGQIKVQFHWDRIGQRDEHSSCWMRVSQLFAGNQRGSMFIPRIGEEVLIDFLEGNPDRPIVTGRLYHGLNRSPYPLPDNKTKSTIKTNSTKGGDGFNEIRIEDKKGEEQIFTHAEKDMEQVTRNDHKEWVGNEHHKIVESNEYRHIKGDEHVKTQQRYSRRVNGDMHLIIGQDHQLKVAKNQYTYAGEELHFTTGVKHALEAGVEISFKAGGSLVTINPGGVTFKGPQVTLNMGGGGSGKRANPKPPQPLNKPTLTAPIAPVHQPGVTELLEPEEYIPTVQLSVAPTTESRAYEGMPYKLYRDGTMIEEGLTNRRGIVTALAPPGTQSFMLELPGEIKLDFPMVEAFPEGDEEELYLAKNKGHREFVSDSVIEGLAAPENYLRQSKQDAQGQKATGDSDNDAV
ncbi:type VI secretion system Vgr family protein [Neptuniibacter sp. QD34_54]|uniref:type VI secretion system Vgr family protein n=1 Tax=Neptuniibacter sp. QD34_54 TaxID=3398208 RepID=UPI0039F4656C